MAISLCVHFRYVAEWNLKPHWNQGLPTKTLLLILTATGFTNNNQPGAFNDLTAASGRPKVSVNNTLRPEQHGRHFVDNILNHIIMSEI